LIIMKFKSINHDDVETVFANATYREYSQMKIFSDEIDEFLMRTDRSDWDIYGKLLCVFKLGVMQGKREERSRRRGKQYTEIRKVLEEQRKLLDEIDNLVINRKANNPAKCTELECEFYKLLNTLNDGK